MVELEKGERKARRKVGSLEAVGSLEGNLAEEI